MNWQQQIDQGLLEGNIEEVARLYEQAVEAEPDIISHYWYLGLVYLLQGQEEAAQTTWLWAMTQGTSEEVEQWTEDVIQILNKEAQRQTNLNNQESSWLIRQHIREIAPTNIDNLLHLIQLALDLDSFAPEVLEEWQVIEQLQQGSPSSVDVALLMQVLAKILDFSHLESVTFVEACVSYCQSSKSTLIDTLISAATKAAYQAGQAAFAADLAELCIKLDPSHLKTLEHLPRFYIRAKRFQEAVDAAKQYCDHCHTLASKFVGNSLLLTTLLGAGLWSEVTPVAQKHKLLLEDLIKLQPTNLDLGVIQFLITNTSYLLYLQDNIQENRWFQTQVAQLFQNNIQANSSGQLKLPLIDPKHNSSRPLRIGYIAHTLRNHSVGWLSRWLFQHHDRDSFKITIYLVNQSADNEFFQTWFGNKVDFVCDGIDDALAIAEKIRSDQIDILVDLDSVTLDVTCTVMAFKPAPIQVTWLGWDASNLPTIDYFIADPYVLSPDAQEHYPETIWRLPQTYIAVDGFEVDVPTLRRDKLGIPEDAVVYLSAQTGFKRHPNTARLQIKILKEVPNSYFLIKGLSDKAAVQEFFTELAESEGVNPNRLRFLPIDPNEFVHRANLQIADIVLDTYPYNGATTTLETLWMGIPIVTRVGEQFSARNSYAFMTNAGLTEGIAWSDQEYVEWGIRLGKDEALRQQVAWKLKKSRQTSPLWDAKQFTREMENAYQQMWAKHLEKVSVAQQEVCTSG